VFPVSHDFASRTPRPRSSSVEERRREGSETATNDEGTGGTTPGTRKCGQSVDQFSVGESKSCGSTVDQAVRLRLRLGRPASPRSLRGLLDHGATMRTPIAVPGLRTTGEEIVQGLNLAEREHEEPTEHEGR